MHKLPVLSGNDVIKDLSRIGYNFDHQTGSHITLVNKSGKKITVPNRRELGPGLLRAIIKQEDLSIEEFPKLL